MVPYLGDFAEDATVYVYFNTFTSDDPSASITVTNLADSDIHVYKDGSETFIVTDGATVIINHDTTDLGDGVHLLTINTGIDAAYSTGSDYAVRVEGITVDAGTINAVVATFSIENRFNAAADDLANVTDGLGALKTLIDAIKDETVLIVADTGELQTDWTNAGRLDAILDIVAADVVNIDGSAMVGTNNAGLATELAKVPKSDSTVTWNATALGSINTQADLALTDYDPPTRTEATADKDVIVTDLDDIKGTSFVKDTHSLIDLKEESVLILADTADIQPNYATSTALSTAQTDLDTISDGIIIGTAVTGTLSTTVCTSNLTGYTDDQLIGRIITFLAGPADGESSDITDYANTNGTITFTAMTLASENLDAFKIT